MDRFDIGNLIYLILLAVVLVGWFVVQSRQSLGKLMQQALAWGLIFLGLIAVIGLWGDIRQTVRPRQSVVTGTNIINVPRAPDGHYYLTLKINGTPIDFLVDTGATQVVLTQNDATRIGLKGDELAFTGRAMTANGEVRTAPVRLELVELGPVRDHDIRAWVNQGDLAQSLLGMSYLQRWSRIEITVQGLRLTR